MESILNRHKIYWNSEMHSLLGNKNDTQPINIKLEQNQTKTRALILLSMANTCLENQTFNRILKLYILNILH